MNIVYKIAKLSLSCVDYMRRERLRCPFCGGENEMFVVDYIFSCSKCGNLWSITELETVYECTGYNCGMLFSKSESDFPANQCPYCAWPYGRKHAEHVCPKCYSEKHEVNVCDQGKIILCSNCYKWFFSK